ncbi:MAG: hypothetical protein JO307_18350, partial [Bryobacterales bacterium]|nr:hypothetical protein [Bryobacterales bacterium]
MNISPIQPDDQQFRSGRLQAEAASAAKEWPRAAGLWDALRNQFPQDSHYWIRAAEAYCAASMLEEAEELLQEAEKRFPGNVWTAYWQTIAARRRGDWAEALRRAEKLRTAFPEIWHGWLEVADALSALGRRQEAKATRFEAAQRFPGEFWPNFWVAWEDAQASEAAGAAQVWSRLVERFPGQPAALSALEAARQAAANVLRHPGLDLGQPVVSSVGDGEYRCPADLAITETGFGRLMVIGSCLSSAWPAIFESRFSGWIAEHFLVNNAVALPAEPPAAANEYDFHL